MKTKKSHIAKSRLELLYSREQVLLLLGWTRETYCDFQFAEYMAFGEAISEGWPAVRNQLLYSPVFRGFWCKAWSQRETTDFIPFAKDCTDYSHKLSEYHHLHSHLRLLEDEAFMDQYNHILDIVRYE